MAADSRKKGRRGGGKRGWKIEEKEDLAFVAASLCPIHPYTLVPVIKQSGLINGDWLLDSIRVNPGADSALLLKFSNHSSWTEWNDSLCANTLTTPGLKLILFDVGRERERERGFASLRLSPRSIEESIVVSGKKLARSYNNRTRLRFSNYLSNQKIGRKLRLDRDRI